MGTGSSSNSSTFISADGGSASSAMYNRKAKSIWATFAGIFAIRDDDVLCFAGWNEVGGGGVNSATQLIQYYTACNTTNYGSETPVQVANFYDGAGGQHSMMVTAEGNIYGTGAGSDYRTGLNSTSTVLLFTRCTGDIRDVTVTRVGTTDKASIALDSTGNVWITGIATANGQLSTSDSQQFTKVTLPAEFFSKTIVNVFGGQGNTFYALDSEGTMWGVGERIRGLGISGTTGYTSKLFTKVPIYDVVPKEFKYTPTLTLDNPNPDYGATIEFKNPNNRAFINLDDKTSNLRLGFVNNENNAGQFKGIQIAADGSLGGGSPLRINSKVGIGVESPGAPLEVVSTRNADTWSSGASQLNVLNYNGYGTWYGMSFAVSQTRGNGVIQTFNKNSGGAAYALELQPSGGSVGIGVASPSYQLQLSTNSAAKPSSTTWTVSSDQRIKEDIVDANLDTCYENIKKLKLKYYKLRDDIIELDPMFKDAHKLGWIAQEVEEVLPKCVTTIPEQYGLTEVKNLDSDQIYTNLFGAVQKLMKENEMLKARIEALENSS
jgi:hypothetical protein